MPGGRDPQRVEQAAVALVGGELDRLDVLGHAGQLVEVVVALGVDVDDPRAAQERLVEQQLERDRLAGAERAGEQRRRAGVRCGRPR